MFRKIADTYRNAFSGLPRELWILSFIALINRAGTMVLPFISLYLTRECGLSVTRAGQVLAVYGLGAMVGSYTGGWLSDRIGADETQRLSLITSGVAFLWLAELRDPVWITVAVFVLSVLSESFRPAVMASVAQRAPEGLQTRAFALLRLTVNIGMGIGPAVGGFLALYSYRWLFIADAATCWIAAIALSFTLIKASGKKGPRASVGPDPRTSPWADVPFLWLTVLVTAVAFIFFQMWSTWPLYLRSDLNFNEGTIGALLGLNAILIVAFEMVLIHSVEDREPMFLIGLGAFLVGAGLAILPFGKSIGFVAFAMVIFTIGEMLNLPLANAVVANRAGPANRGRYMGMYTMAFSVAFVFAPALGMWVYDRMGPDTLFFGVGILGAVLWVVAVLLRPSMGDLSERKAAR